MNPSDYYKSVTLELDALKSRVRNLIADGHWPTDGEWKESVLRTVLRRHMPSTTGVGRGFVVSQSGASSQIDVLLYETAKPVLHQDGELVFVTPDAVRGIIEVKSTLRRSQLGEILGKLANNADLVPGGGAKVFLGLFAYEADLGQGGDDFLRSALQSTAGGSEMRAVNHVCAGWSLFAKYWPKHPFTGLQMQQWYTYNVDEMAPGYFLVNALESLVGQPIRDNLWAWYPAGGKEIHKSGEISLHAHPTTQSGEAID